MEANARSIEEPGGVRKAAILMISLGEDTREGENGLLSMKEKETI